MNIQVQCCGIVILLLIWYFSLRQKTLGLESKKLFLITMGVTSFCVVMDIISIVAICNRETISGFLLAFVCKTYIVSLIWVGYFGLLYASTDFIGTRKERKKKNRVYTLIVLTGTVLIYALPIHYYLEGNVVYTYGPSCSATYLFALLFVLATLYKVLARGREMNPKRKRAIIIWMVIWIIAAVTQFLNANLLLVGFASVLGMVILFFELENPEANLDRETGAYNAHALGEYTKLLYEERKSFSAMLLALNDTAAAENEKDGQSAHTDMALRDIVRYADKLKDVKVFKTLERELVFLTDSETRMREVFREIKDYVEEGREQDGNDCQPKVSPHYVLLPDSLLLRNVGELFQMLRSFRTGKQDDPEENSITLDEEKIGHYKERGETEAMIRAAMEEDRVEVFYQPIYSTVERRFVSAEALARIRDRDGSIVPPGRFIPVAEKNGQISQIGEIVFEKTCAFIQENQLKEKYGIRYIEVNLSVRQCEEPKLAEKYIRIMEKYRLDPACINLEITESTSIRIRNNLLKNMQILIDYGVRFSLDDFGSGASNLNYIIDMPVSIVKFDRDMSQAYFANRKARFVMEASMRMIHDMELEIVSEGVETEEQKDAIVALGIEFIQGYYFSRPLAGEEFLQFVGGYLSAG
ncbi:MAG: EAL domain-containing protein [Lachnospiraceae bacterium]|nr:EAL domain-containing protein [Lachnospiraceae bacterium]MCM1241171.1 EAL domain-containing protein [Lachnospiraceae bacterium]